MQDRRGGVYGVLRDGGLHKKLYLSVEVTVSQQTTYEQYASPTVRSVFCTTLAEAGRRFEERSF